MTFFKHTHLLGFAVPIFENKVVVAGLSIFLPEYRFSASRKREIVQALREAAEVITRKLSYNG